MPFCNHYCSMLANVVHDILSMSFRYALVPFCNYYCRMLANVVHDVLSMSFRYVLVLAYSESLSLLRAMLLCDDQREVVEMTMMSSMSVVCPHNIDLENW